MKRFYLLLLTLSAIIAAPAAVPAPELTDSLERALSLRTSALDRKVERIDSIKAHLLGANLSPQRRMEIYDRLCAEYLTYSFDSTMAYVDRWKSIPESGSDYATAAKVAIYHSQALATSGHFSQAVEILDKIDSGKLPTELQALYYTACRWAYGTWADYAHDSAFAKDYSRRSALYLDSIIDATPPLTPQHNYALGARAYHKGDHEAARLLYAEALEGVDHNDRLYAQSAFAMALACLGGGDEQGYADWLARAAIADQSIPLKENLALQTLATHLAEEGHTERANRYLRYSLEDAIFYNDRLRMVEIAGKIPAIALAYQDMVSGQNTRLRIYLCAIALLLIGLGALTMMLVRQRRRIALSNHELALLNRRLEKLNSQLADTNRHREQYVSLFMDLCAAYIKKLQDLRATVSLKLKVKQLDDLQRLTSGTSRPTEAELRELFRNFDTAFLKLYPDFINRFNELLRPTERIELKPDMLLNTDLRIFALIRMGITDSNKIATLLFYSPQTIFNRRTAMRNRASDRATFEQEVMKICEYRQ